LVAWAPSAGDVVPDKSAYGRHAAVDGTAAYDGVGLVLDGRTYLRTEPLSLGFLREATFAAEVKIGGTGYRRLFDFQPGGDPGTDGVLIDLTPSGAVRFIGANQGVTTGAVVPTGRYLDLVVVMGRDGQVDVYVDGVRAGGARVSGAGINGCATRQLRFAADQDGGQRLTGAVGRAAVFPVALSADQVGSWRTRAFG
jgi:alpha-L-fucosidase 2